MQKHSAVYIKNRIIDCRNENNSMYFFVNATTPNNIIPIILEGEEIKYYYYPGMVDVTIPEYIDTLNSILNRKNRNMYIKDEDTSKVGIRIEESEYKKMLQIKAPYLVRQTYFTKNGVPKYAVQKKNSMVQEKEFNAAVAYLIDNNFKVERHDISGLFMISDSADYR
ncbi:MAG: hypothetical protein A3F72_09630 [Bacteroidetes bacterium RIFCSPLOWO2_12_FULL_35_15]|nr:MAG: hypothetical protein A3F72_09630 [Bacteroidetes bacterium RIFCSPLOWO2_12_FULL_35_15]